MGIVQYRDPGVIWQRPVWQQPAASGGDAPGAASYCRHCGLWHAGACRRIRSIEYWPDGTVRRVEYHPPEY